MGDRERSGSKERKKKGRKKSPLNRGYNKAYGWLKNQIQNENSESSSTNTSSSDSEDRRDRNSRITVNLARKPKRKRNQHDPAHSRKIDTENSGIKDIPKLDEAKSKERRNGGGAPSPKSGSDSEKMETLKDEPKPAKKKVDHDLETLRIVSNEVFSVSEEPTTIEQRETNLPKYDATKDIQEKFAKLQMQSTCSTTNTETVQSSKMKQPVTAQSAVSSSKAAVGSPKVPVPFLGGWMSPFHRSSTDEGLAGTTPKKKLPPPPPPPKKPMLPPGGRYISMMDNLGLFNRKRPPGHVLSHQMKPPTFVPLKGEQTKEQCKLNQQENVNRMTPVAVQPTSNPFAINKAPERIHDDDSTSNEEGSLQEAVDHNPDPLNPLDTGTDEHPIPLPTRTPPPVVISGGG